jgi:hypothetical protein
MLALAPRRDPADRHFRAHTVTSTHPATLRADALSISSVGSASDSSRPSPLSLDTPPPHKSRRSSESSRATPQRRIGADRAGSVSSFAAPLRASLLQDIAAAQHLRPHASVSLPTSPVPGTARVHHHGHTPSGASASAHHKPRRTPIVYPALLSRVAEAFHSRVALADRVKDGLTYKDAFDGRQAVDKIAYIIKTTDRNLALLLGRALDAQKFFHAVTYDHRLRDSAADLYQFRGRGPFGSGELELELAPPSTVETVPPARPASTATQGSSGSPSHEGGAEPDAAAAAEADAEPALPTGVFTLLTDCYSPTCSREQLCYSITCPRRLEQQARLKRPPAAGFGFGLRDGLERVEQDEGGTEIGLAEPGTLWVHSVPKEIVDSVSDQEKRRQEAINEVMYTERQFVLALEYLRDVRSVFLFSPPSPSDLIDPRTCTVLDDAAQDARHHPRGAPPGLCRAGVLERRGRARGEHAPARCAVQAPEAVRRRRGRRGHLLRRRPALCAVCGVRRAPDVRQVRV